MPLPLGSPHASCSGASLHSGGPGEERWDAREALLHVFNPQEDLEQDQQEAGGGLEAPPPPSLKFRDGCWAAGSEPPAHRADLKSYHCRPLPAPPVIQLPPGNLQDLGHRLLMPRARVFWALPRLTTSHPTSQDEKPGGAS